MKNLAWVDNDDLSQLPQFQSPEQLSSSDDSGGIVGGGGTGEGDQTSFSTIPQSSIIPVKSRRGTSVRFNRERLGCLWSIPILVISIFSILVIITAIGVWIPVVVSAYATVQEGSKTNRDFRQRLIVQYSLRIASQAHSVIDLAYQYLYWDKSLLMIHEECESRLRKVLHSSIYSFNMINRLNYASSNNGKLTGVINSRPVASLLSTIVYSSNHNNNNNISILARYSMNTENGELGQFQQIEQESNNEDKSSYDSRLEPWYQMTTDTLHYNVNGSKIWNKYSIDFNAKKLITSISRPIYEQHKYLSNEHSGHLLGVLSATIHLDQLSDYLSQIQHYGHGTVFILDSEGYLIACNEKKVMITHNNNYIRLKGDTHSNRFIREASNRVLHNYIIPNKLVYYNKQQQPSTTSTTTTTSSTLTTLPTQSLSFAMGGKQVVLRVSGIRDDYGLQWIIVVSSSHEQMYSKVKRANIVSGIVALISLLLSIVGSILVGFIITKPLNQLSQQMYRVALMDFENYANSSLFTLYEFAKMGRALNRMKEGLHTFSIYVPGDVVRQILSKGQGAELGLTTKTLTILICDIVNSTNMCENTDPIILIGVMQDFFTITNDIIADNEGTVDKYIGDCVMAIFNAPTDIVDHQLKAIRAAVKISTKLEECNLAWARKNYPHIAIRTGINTAKCLVGNVGAPQRMNYTALGEGVNIANLLEKFNNRYRTKILIGENTFRSRHVQETFSCRWIDFVKVRGIQRPFNIYEIRGYNSDLSNEDHHITHMHQRIRDHLLCGRVDKSRKLCDKISNYPIQLLNKRLSTIHHNQNSNRSADHDDAQLYYEFNESVAEYDQSIY